MRKFFYSVIIGIIVTASVVCYSETVQSEVAQNVLRLHVIANSDSAEDQALKLKVRDRILAESNSFLKDSQSLSETGDLIYNNLDFLTNAAQDEIIKQGYDYPVRLSLGESSFPAKEYGNIALPAGDYQALRVEIGNASGQNWWCVIFPPLCFVDASLGKADAESLAVLQSNLSSESYSLITGDSPSVEIRFKIVDFVQSSAETIKTVLTKK